MVENFDYIIHNGQGEPQGGIWTTLRHGRNKGVSYADISGTIILGRGIPSTKNLGRSLQTSRNNEEARVTGAEWAVEKKIRRWGQWGSRVV